MAPLRQERDGSRLGDTVVTTGLSALGDAVVTTGLRDAGAGGRHNRVGAEGRCGDRDGQG